MTDGGSVLRDVRRELRAAARGAVFVLELMPMLPSRFLERLSPTPRREAIVFPTADGDAAADVFRPAAGGPYPGIAVSLGVVPAGLEHPQIPRLGRALARAGFVALVYWSPAMHDRRLEPDDAGRLAAAFEHLLRLPAVDARRCGLLGTCVGASFALLAATQPSIRDRVAFVVAFAPYASLETFVGAIASRTRAADGGRRAWPLDPLTWAVYVRTLTSTLGPDEAELLRAEFASPDRTAGAAPPTGLGNDALAVRHLLAPLPYEETAAATAALPAELVQRLREMSPLAFLDDLRAPLVVVGHDRDDFVIPVDESRLLRDSLAHRPGFHYTEFGLFEHADPTKRRLAPHRLLFELGRFARYVHPVLRV